MSGHSKWSNIQGRKNAQDAKRGKIFQKVSREIYMAAKAGGPDPAMNPALRLAVDKAKSANMPNDNIARAIKKASSAGEGEHYDEVTYEGYGPGGVAVLVHALTAVSYTHLRAHETGRNLVCRLLLEKNFFNDTATTEIYT